MNAHARENLSSLIEDLPTKSAKIRKLAEAGMSRSEIAKFLGLRYQHVRNVLVADEKKAEAAREAPKPVHVKVDDAGRVLLPAAYRDWLGIEPGEALLLLAEGDGLKLVTLQRALKDAQALVRRYVPDGSGIVDDFIAQRRAEAERE